MCLLYCYECSLGEKVDSNFDCRPGLVDCRAGVRWLLMLDEYAWAALLLGLVGGWFVYSLGFAGFVRKNLERIRQLAPQKDRICMFAFQHWRSYIIVVGAPCSYSEWQVQ